MGDVIEYVVINGRRYCACSVAVLEMAEAGFKAAGIIPKSASIHDYVSQGGYRAGATAASKGSHDRGGVHDTWFSLVNTDAKQRIWDQAGAVGCRRFSWEFTSTNTPDHGHIIAVGCPHLAEFAADQLAEIRRGGDGMAGTRGWAGPTPSFTPWRTRYAAFKQQQLEEDDMPYTRDQLLEIVETAVSRQLWAPAVPGADGVAGSSIRNNIRHQSAAASNVLAIVQGLAAKAGVDVDEAAIAREVAASVLPALTAALVAKLDGIAGVDASVLAREVVAELGAALQG